MACEFHTDSQRQWRRGSPGLSLSMLGVQKNKWTDEWDVGSMKEPSPANQERTKNQGGENKERLAGPASAQRGFWTTVPRWRTDINKQPRAEGYSSVAECGLFIMLEALVFIPRNYSPPQTTTIDIVQNRVAISKAIPFDIPKRGPRIHLTGIPPPRVLWKKCQSFCPLPPGQD